MEQNGCVSDGGEPNSRNANGTQKAAVGVAGTDVGVVFDVAVGCEKREGGPQLEH